MKIASAICYLLSACISTATAQSMMNPNTCKIKGKVIAILKPEAHSKYANKAKIKIITSEECGSSVTQPPHAGDIVTVSFAYTVCNTIRSFPKIKPPLPGLKKGNTFTANAEEQLLPGGKVDHIIYDYSLK